MKRVLILLGVVAAGAAALMSLGSCSTKHAQRDPTGEVFPSVRGQSLSGEDVAIPGGLLGSPPEPTVVIVGYKMFSQFDIDRWLLALVERHPDLRVFELPTVQGMLPGAFAGRIDEGMRSGIPSEDWASVVTVYRDASTIARFTGNKNPTPARVMLLDREGRVAYFHDRGFSPGSLLALEAALALLRKTE